MGRPSIACMWLALGAGIVAAGPPSLVLGSATQVRFESGGILTRVEAEVHTLALPADTIAVPAEAGAWLAYAARPGAAFVAGRNGLEPQLIGSASFELTAWRPEPTSKELRLALPAAPGSTLSVACERDLPFELVGHGPLVKQPDGTWTAPLPVDGMAWLRWSGEPALGRRDYLESSRLEVAVELDRISFRAQIRGHTRQRSLALPLGPGVVLDDSLASGASDPEGVHVATVEPGWFDLALIGRIEPRGDLVRLAPFEVKGLPRATGVQVVVLPRSARKLVSVEDRTEDWSASELSGGVRRFLLRPGDGVRPYLEFKLRGKADVEPTPAGIDRITVRSGPSSRAMDRVESQVTYRIGRKGPLRLAVPEGVELSRFQLDGARFAMAEFRESADGTRFATGEVLLPGVLAMTVVHPPLPGELAGGVFELAVPHPARESTEIEWSGRLPDGYLCLGAGRQDPAFVWSPPYPLRWMIGLLDGLVTVGREAGIPVTFALAGLLALYAYLFLPPPSRQSAYTAAVLLASAATLVGLVHAARAPPRGARSPAEGESADPGGLFSFPAMGDALRRMSPLALPGAGSGAHGAVEDPAARARDGSSPAPGHGPPGLPGTEVPGFGADPRSGATARRSPEPEAGVPAQPDQWELTLVAAPASGAQGEAPAQPRIRVRVVPGKGPLALALLLALAVLGVVGFQVRSPDPRLELAVVGLAAGMLPLDMLAPEPLFPATVSLLAALLGAAGYRGGRQLLLFWERVRHEIERRRVSAARTRGRDPEDDGDEPAPRGGLRKNELSYEQVFRDEDGIEFIPEAGAGAPP